MKDKGGGGEPLLLVQDLVVEYKSGRERIRAIDSISFSLEKGTCLGLVGPSGCGKTAICLSILGLLDDNGSASGKIIYEGRNLLEMKEGELRKIRGKKIAMVFQNSHNALNPVFTVGHQLDEATRSKEESLRLMRLTGLSEKLYSSYPHELSGGMRQRALIAIALAGKSEILICDEPTSAMDVTIQAQIIDILDHIKDEGISLILVSHDLGVIASLADEVIVMNEGKIVEKQAAEDLFASPKTSYTAKLIRESQSVMLHTVAQR